MAPPQRVVRLLASIAMTQPPPPPLTGGGPPGWGPNPYGPVRTVAADPHKRNRLAVFGFISSLLGCFGVFALGGLAMGIVALNQLRRVPQRGRGLAWSAIVISSAWLVAAVALLSLGLLEAPSDTIDRALNPPGTAQRDEHAEIVQSGTVALADLRQGDCLLSNKYVDVRMLQAVPCREYHKIEVVARYQLHNTDPSSAAAQQESLERCQGAFGVYAPRAVSDPNLTVQVLPPTTARGSPYKSVICWAYDEYHLRQGSIKG